jgi:hypothetical protein
MPAVCSLIQQLPVAIPFDPAIDALQLLTPAVTVTCPIGAAVAVAEWPMTRTSIAIG